MANSSELKAQLDALDAAIDADRARIEAMSSNLDTLALEADHQEYSDLKEALEVLRDDLDLNERKRRALCARIEQAVLEESDAAHTEAEAAVARARADAIEAAGRWDEALANLSEAYSELHDLWNESHAAATTLNMQHGAFKVSGGVYEDAVKLALDKAGYPDFPLHGVLTLRRNDSRTLAQRLGLVTHDA